jgi:MFS family permease
LTPDRLTRHFVLLRALRWLPIGLVLPFLVITPAARGLSLGAIGAVFAVHSAVAILLEIPSGALADALGRRRISLAGAGLTALSLLAFALAQSAPGFMASAALLAAGRALISGALEAWYVDSLRLLDPLAPLARGLSRGSAAEGIAMAIGSLVGGALVATSSPDAGGGPFSGYGLAATGGAVAALAYLAAIAALVHEPPVAADRRASSIGYRTREVIATARAEATASVTVRIVFTTGVAFGVCLTAVELLWQPHLADMLTTASTGGLAFGALAAASMLAVAVGAGLSPIAGRRIGLRRGYVVAIAFTAACIAMLGAPASPLGFAAVYLLAYLGLGIAEPMHYELLNEAVGPMARATLISAESLATQCGALVANLGVGALAAAHGANATWTVAGLLLALTCVAVAPSLCRTRAEMSRARPQ